VSIESIEEVLTGPRLEDIDIVLDISHQCVGIPCDNYGSPKCTCYFQSYPQFVEVGSVAFFIVAIVVGVKAEGIVWLFDFELFFGYCSLIKFRYAFIYGCWFVSLMVVLSHLLYI
jgi:hypothetical protein